MSHEILTAPNDSPETVRKSSEELAYEITYTKAPSQLSNTELQLAALTLCGNEAYFDRYNQLVAEIDQRILSVNQYSADELTKTRSALGATGLHVVTGVTKAS